MLTHIDANNQPTMVDVSEKAVTHRYAHARCRVKLPATISLELTQGDISSKKGPVFQTAIIAGTMAAKKTSELIPFCHPIALESCKIYLTLTEANTIQIDAHVRSSDKTGVEMEAMTAATVAGLTVYDMCKAMSAEISLDSVELMAKSGGKRDFKR